MREGDDLVLDLTGEPSDVVLLFAALGAGHQPYAVHHGVFLLGGPLLIVGLPVATVPAGGASSVELRIPELGPGVQALDVHVQAAFHDGSAVLLGGAVVATLLDDAF